MKSFSKIGESATKLQFIKVWKTTYSKSTRNGQKFSFDTEY